VVDWGVSGCPGYETATYWSQDTQAPPVRCSPLGPVDLYLNNAANKVFSYIPNQLPVGPNGRSLLLRELNTFTTEHELNPSAYSYTARMMAFAIDPTTNLSVNIVQFTIPNLIDGFTTSSHDTKTTDALAYETDSGTTTVEVESRALEVKIARSKLARALTSCISAANWLLTYLSAHVTFAAVTKKNADFFTVFLHGCMMLAVLVTWKLSIGTLLFLDSVAFFPQLVIMAFCSVVLLYTAAKSRFLARNPSARFSWCDLEKS